MAEKATPEKVEKLFSQLPTEDRTELLRKLENESNPVGNESVSLSKLAQLQIKEADWVTAEIQESIKLIQQYRGLYMTAVFLTLGWVIGQIISSSISATNAAPGTEPRVFNLASIRHHADVAVLLTGVGLVNLLFMTLTLEVYAQLGSLARYRFILGYELGGGKPAWRYERWKDTKEGSIRPWTNPLNTLYFFFSTFVSLIVLWFPIPAVWETPFFFLKAFWWIVVFLFFWLTGRAIVLGIRIRRRTPVADEPKIHWVDLELPKKETPRQENESK